MEETLVFTVVAAPLLVGLVQMLKNTPLLQAPRDAYAGLLSFVLGVAFGVGWQLFGEPFMSNAFFAGLQGAIAGLTAAGLYSTTKASKDQIQEPSTPDYSVPDRDTYGT